MRLDHYIKIGDNDIHMAQLVYSATTVACLILSLTLVLSKKIKKDFSNIELLKLNKKEKKAARSISR